MGIKFYGGPYDGIEAEHTAINRHAIIHPLRSISDSG
jgi:hypothetical protein